VLPLPIVEHPQIIEHAPPCLRSGFVRFVLHLFSL
jgi:hypothetical protein